MQKRQISIEDLRVKTNEKSQRVKLTIKPVRQAGRLGELLMVVFEDVDATAPTPQKLKRAFGPRGARRIEQLEQEVKHGQEHLQTIIEELETSNKEHKSANEELQSTNEELRSANEELESSREELQSLNEELSTVDPERSTAIFRILQEALTNVARHAQANKVLVDLRSEG